MNKLRLSADQAYDAMVAFLLAYYERTGGKGELGSLLGDLQRSRTDGHPFDPAAWDDWLSAVEAGGRGDRDRKAAAAKGRVVG